MTNFRYGAGSSVQLDFAEGTEPVELGTPPGRPPAELSAAVADALGEPLEYPSLAHCTTPGDRVVLALAPGVPQVAQITVAVVQALVDDARVDPNGITVLRPSPESDTSTEDPCRLLPVSIRRRIMVVIHDPDDRDMLAYLTAGDTDEPILLNRALHEADLVLPIGCLHGESTAGYFGIHGVVFPTFSDRKTAARFRSIGSLHSDGKRRKELTAEVDQIAWLLGVHFAIQVVPAAGSSVLHVLAGCSDAVARRGRELYDAAWSCAAPQQASLVVAAVEGDSEQQTWHNVGRALNAATELVEDGGSVAVCCDLSTLPGAAMQRLIGSESHRAALRRIRKDRPEDALPAVQLARAMDRGKVYLLSRLEESVVEDLDVIPIGNGAELARLVRRHTSCILLSNAQYAVVKSPHIACGGMET